MMRRASVLIEALGRNIILNARRAGIERMDGLIEN